MNTNSKESGGQQVLALDNNTELKPRDKTRRTIVEYGPDSDTRKKYNFQFMTMNEWGLLWGSGLQAFAPPPLWGNRVTACKQQLDSIAFIFNSSFFYPPPFFFFFTPSTFPKEDPFLSSPLMSFEGQKFHFSREIFTQLSLNFLLKAITDLQKTITFFRSNITFSK